MPGEITDPTFVPSIGGVAASWSTLPGKPATFPPESHDHPISEVEDLTTSLATEATTRATADAALADAVADKADGPLFLTAAPVSSYYQFTTAMAGLNNDIVLTQLDSGTPIQFQIVDSIPPGGNEILAWDSVDRILTFAPGKNGGGSIVSTAALLVEQINSLATYTGPIAAGTIVAQLAAGNDGTGVVAVLALTAFPAVPGTAATALGQTAYVVAGGAITAEYRSTQLSPVRWERVEKAYDPSVVLFTMDGYESDTELFLRYQNGGFEFSDEDLLSVGYSTAWGAWYVQTGEATFRAAAGPSSDHPTALVFDSDAYGDPVTPFPVLLPVTAATAAGYLAGLARRDAVHQQAIAAQVTGTGVTAVVNLTQAEYDALISASAIVATTLYCITG